MSILQDLRKFNLSDAEARVYLAALELGETSIERIATKAGVKRTTAYGIIHTLREKKLLTRSKNRKKNVYAAEDPRVLNEAIEERRSTLDHLVPQLLAIAKATDKKTRVRFFQGKDYIEKIHIEAFSYPGREYVVWVPGKVFDADLDLTFWNQYYMPKRLELKIPVRFIAANVPSARAFQQNDHKWLKQTRLTSESFIKTFCVLYGGSQVAFISTTDSTAVVLDNKETHDTLYGLFELHWSSLQ